MNAHIKRLLRRSLLSAVFFAAILCSVASKDDLPPVRTEVRYAEDTELRNDDPNKAWEEWGETDDTRKNPFPKRQREIKEGMDIHTIMGMAMRQPKVVTAVLASEFGSSDRIGQMIIGKYKNQMAAAGIGCAMYFVLKGRQVVARCETIRDGHMAKDYLVRQPEIIRTVLDNIPFTPKPQIDSDDESEEEVASATNKKEIDNKTSNLAFANGDDDDSKKEL